MRSVKRQKPEGLPRRLSALLLPDSKPRQALDVALQKGKVLIGLAVLAEIFEVLNRKRFRRYIDEEDVRGFLGALTREAEYVQVDEHIAACRDPKDDKFLELAMSGHANYIVSGDSDLLALNPFRGVVIAPPHTFLKLIQQS